MLVGIHRNMSSERSSSLERYKKILDHNGIQSIWLDASGSDFWDNIRLLDLFIFRWGHYDSDRQLAHTILPIIECEIGVKCFPNLKTAWHYDDKIKQYYLMNTYGFPMVESYIFWNKTSALEWLAGAKLPIICKLKNGAGSKNVDLIKSHRHAIKYINKMFKSGMIPFQINPGRNIIVRKSRHVASRLSRKLKKLDPLENWQLQKNYVLFQKYLPDNEYDTRVTIIGNRAFSFRRINRRGDFRASGSGLIDYDINKIDNRCIEIAFSVSQKMGFQTMAYDFIYDKNKEPKFCEISYTYLDTAIYNCPGYFDSKFNWHKGNYWPQYCLLVDLLNKKQLKQPSNLS